MIIQIYEIQTPEEAETVVGLGVDHVGSVLLAEERWQVASVKETVDLVRRTGKSSSLIPLFTRPEVICRALDYYRPDIVHLCDEFLDDDGKTESGKWLLENQIFIKNRFPEIRIMRSIPVPDRVVSEGQHKFVLDIARHFETASDLFLTDTVLTSPDPSVPTAQPVSGFVGITGKTCDWNLAAELIRITKIPVILAGGLGPENVFEAIAETRPFGVDSCSGTNKVDDGGTGVRFKKDMRRVAQFVDAANAAAFKVNLR